MVVCNNETFENGSLKGFWVDRFVSGDIHQKEILTWKTKKKFQWVKEGNSVWEKSVDLFLRVRGLREYSRYLCFNFSSTHEGPLLSNSKLFRWHADHVHFKAWRQGRTGYPLVDVGMWELWATGWIHNRIKVIITFHPQPHHHARPSRMSPSTISITFNFIPLSPCTYPCWYPFFPWPPHVNISITLTYHLESLQPVHLSPHPVIGAPR